MKFLRSIQSIRIQHILFLLLFLISCIAAYITFINGATVIYNDAESHLYIAKRVIHSITPGLAQFGSVWLPFQHILMIPFIWYEPFFRNGLAGAFASMTMYLLMGVLFYKLLSLQTKKLAPVVVGCAVLLLNPNILYFQSIPMNEVIFLSLGIGSVYFLVRWWNSLSVPDMIFASFFACLATMTRYEAWFLTAFESAVIMLRIFLKERSLLKFHKYEGLLFFHGFIAYSGAIGWLLWGWILIGDPLYFQRSEYSAQAQQQEFLKRGELLTINNIQESAHHFYGAVYHNLGHWMMIIAGVAGVVYILSSIVKRYPISRHIPVVLFSSPVVFSLYALYKGQTIIFVPGITPEEFGNNLFNIRYGLNAFPLLAYTIAMGVDALPRFIGWLLLPVVILVYALMLQNNDIITYRDGVGGISSRVNPASDAWLAEHYDGGLVVYDDFNRSMSVIRSGVPMQNAVYIGNKPYFETTLKHPEKYARYIIISQNDTIYKNLYVKKSYKQRLDDTFDLVYKDSVTMIYKRKESH